MSSDNTSIDDSLSVRQDGLLDTVPLYVTTALFLSTIVLATEELEARRDHLDVHESWVSDAYETLRSAEAMRRDRADELIDEYL